MLRLLCKLQEPEILEPLVPSIKMCLEHRHSYVRKHAALALYHIHKYFGHSLVPDGAELVERFISVETELGSRRNAFLMLFNEAENVAIDFLRANAGDLDRFGDGFALLVLELTRKVCRRDPAEKSQFVHFLFQLLGSSSAAVSYETAWTLASLSSAPTAIRAAASTYTELLCSQSDNNVKLIVLERLAEMKRRHARVLSEILMDILRALSSPNVDICKRTLEIMMGLVSPRNIEEVMQVLKREVLRTRTNELEQGTEYRALLINSIHACAIKFPNVAGSVVHVLMDFLGADGAIDVILFIRSIIQQYPSMRTEILEKLLASFAEIQQSPVLAIALWILGEFLDADLLADGFDHIVQSLNPVLEFIEPVEVEISHAGNIDESQRNKSVILADGTYGTQSVSASNIGTGATTSPALGRLIQSGDIYLGTVVVSALTKLTCRTLQLDGSTSHVSKHRQFVTLSLCCVLSKMIESDTSATSAANFGPSSNIRTISDSVDSSVASDSLDRLAFFSHLLLEPQLAHLRSSILTDGKVSLQCCLQHSQASMRYSELDSGRDNPPDRINQPDDLIVWRQLMPETANGVTSELWDVGDLQTATSVREMTDSFGVRLSHTYQLSGFADPIYAEACVTVHDYDIVLEILVVNRTSSTLTNLTVELATMGDLKLVERPQSLTIGPLAQQNIRANIKVSSTETGHIFGTVVFDKSNSAEKNYVNLNNIHLDIMDYIRPASCTDEAFRHMWAEFEWENKVAIATTILGLGEFLEHIVQCTNMSCLTPRSSLNGDSTFLAANLYAKSIFGEDALVNVSVEKKSDADGKLSGYIRIRSKTQGIALSLGDRITAVQRGISVNTS